MSARRAAAGVEARPGVEHLDAQHAVGERDAHLDLALLADVLDGVGDQLGDEQAGVLERLLADVVADALEKHGALRGRTG